MPVVQALVLFALARFAAADTPVTGARLTIVEKAVPQIEVTIENRRDTDLVEWQVGAGWAISGGRSSIAPHAQKTVVLNRSTAPGGPPPRVLVALFADGSYEGAGPPFETWLKERRDHADDLHYWIDAFMSMPRVSLVALRRYLDERLAARAVSDRPNTSHVSDRVRDILERYPDDPSIWPPLDRLKAEVEAEFLQVSRQHGPAPGAGDVTGVAVVSVRESASKTYAVTVENLRDIAIEALRVDQLDETGRRRGSLTSDSCVADPADRTPGRGRIQPHERRELPLYPEPGEVPRYVVSLVLYDDLSYEGSADAHDEVLRSRAELAFEYEFAIESLTPIATISPGGVEAYLAGRKAEWARRLQEQGKRPRGRSPLDEAIRQAHESPDQFVGGSGASYRGVLEQQLARLRRHLPPGGIAGARLTVVEKSGRTLLVTIENQRDSPLVAWRIDSSWVSFGGGDIVAPHQRRQVSLEIQNGGPETRPASLELAAFEDGYYEGRGRMFEQWVAERNERREDLKYWVTALQAMPRVSEPALREYLADRIAARAGGEMHTIRHVSDRLEEVTRRFPEGPEIWPRLDELRKTVEAEYLAATRMPQGRQSGATDVVTAATVVATDLRPSTSYSIVIENLRDVSIEAYGIQDFNLVTGNRGGGSWTDFRAQDPAQDKAGRGRILPHEKRDLESAFGPGPVVPLAKLWFVMFDDMQFEGDPVMRAQLLRQREWQAEDAEFALSILDEAAKRPAAELEAFFVTKRQAYLRSREGDGGRPQEHTIEGFLRMFRWSSPAQFLADIPATRTRLEEAVARLRVRPPG